MKSIGNIFCSWKFSVTNWSWASAQDPKLCRCEKLTPVKLEHRGEDWGDTERWSTRPTGCGPLAVSYLLLIRYEAVSSTPVIGLEMVALRSCEARDTIYQTHTHMCVCLVAASYQPASQLWPPNPPDARRASYRYTHWSMPVLRQQAKKRIHKLLTLGFASCLTSSISLSEMMSR